MILLPTKREDGRTSAKSKTAAASALAQRASKKTR